MYEHTRTVTLQKPVHQYGFGVKKEAVVQELCFESLGDCIDAKPRWPVNGQNWERSGSMFTPGAREWYGIKTKEKLEAAVLSGWPEVHERVRQLVGEIKLPEALMRPELKRRRKRERGDFGNEVDIHEVNQGRADRAWDRVHQVPVMVHGSKLCHIVAKIGSAGYITADQALWRAAVIIRIYEALVRMGKSVAITVFDVGGGGMMNGDTWLCSCQVKAYGQALDERKLAALSTLGFARWYLMERGVSCMTSEPSSGRGRDVDDNRVIPHSAAEDEAVRGGALVIIGNCYNQREAIEVINKFVRQFTFGETTRGSIQLHDALQAEANSHE